MNRARQQALLQATNQAVLDIRQSQIQYYLNLHINFGTQSVILAGFVYATFTQNIVNEENLYVDHYQFVYWVTSVITIATAVHILLCTMILQIYGPGLSINGPLGSMVRAAEGMRAEQNQIIASFTFMILSYAMSTVWMFWIVSDFNTSVATSAVFAIALYRMYYHCERIYLRFYWNKGESDWNNGDIEDNGLSFSEEPGANVGINSPMHAVVGGDNSDTNSTNNDKKGTFTQKKVRFPVLTYLGILKDKSNDTTNSEADSSGGTTDPNNKIKGVVLNSTHIKTQIAMEGYLTTKGRMEQQLFLEHSYWDRIYFVLFKTGEIYVYKTRQDFRSEARKPLYKRPLRLIDYFLKVSNPEEIRRAAELEQAAASAAGGATTAAAAPAATTSKKVKFQMVLVPRENETADNGGTQVRNQWTMNCDTEEEMDIWVGIILDICPSCLRKENSGMQ